MTTLIPESFAEPLVALSTDYLSDETMSLIEQDACRHVILYPNEYGAFVCVTDGACELAEPQDLRVCLIWARKHGFQWVKFDPDGRVFEDLQK